MRTIQILQLMAFLLLVQVGAAQAAILRFVEVEGRIANIRGNQVQMEVDGKFIVVPRSAFKDPENIRPETRRKAYVGWKEIRLDPAHPSNRGQAQGKTAASERRMTREPAASRRSQQ